MYAGRGAPPSLRKPFRRGGGRVFRLFLAGPFFIYVPSPDPKGVLKLLTHVGLGTALLCMPICEPGIEGEYLHRGVPAFRLVLSACLPLFSSSLPTVSPPPPPNKK